MASSQRQRIADCIETRDERPGLQSLGQSRQEGRAGRNGKDARCFALRHDLPVRARCDGRLGSGMASGVPTVIQLPSIAMPKSRPAAIARSK